MDYTPRTLPAAALELCKKLNAQPRLVAHLSLVHDASVEITEGLRKSFPKLQFDSDEVHFGAATHDVGKTIHPDELTGPGHLHEKNGPDLLERHGVSPELARFARTHGAWDRGRPTLEDLLVALADNVWKGRRLAELESLIVAKIAEETHREEWDVFDTLDRVLDKIAARGNERLAWQQSY